MEVIAATFPVTPPTLQWSQLRALLLPSFPFTPNVDLNLIKSERRPKPCYTAILAEQYKDAGWLDMHSVSITVVPVFSSHQGPESAKTKTILSLRAWQLLLQS